MTNTWETLFSNAWSDRADSAPIELQAWLSSRGSLTTKLTAACQSGFKVQLLHQHLCFATEAAADALGLECGAPLLHREVLLQDGDRPLVFACSLLPEIALNNQYEELRQLDERPLGHWIFAEPALTRARVCFAALSTQDNLFVRVPSLHQESPPCWGRVTYFQGAAAPLLVSEFFLDEGWAEANAPVSD
ncbi:MAG: chorismate--pyruvate lyase family protein [Granulosicoccaceae bacterium]